MSLPSTVRIYEVGPRDGLQNEAQLIPTDEKAEFIRLLMLAGLREIEVTSFVSPRAVPQLADAAELLRMLPQVLPAEAPLRLPVLVPNMRGLERAREAGVTSIAVFTAASDAFTTKNIGMTIDESLAAFKPVIEGAKADGSWTRGYVSTAFGCPYTGQVDPLRVVEVSLALMELGVDEVCLGDTIGVGVPFEVHALTALHTAAGIPLGCLAYHFHDTRGTALANVVAGLEDGITCFDASTGGTGGCPYAPGAAGNLATEDLVYLLDAMSIQHGVRLEGVLAAGRFISGVLGRPVSSKVGQAGGWDPVTGRPIGRS